jgi:competence protein ComEC
LLDSCALVDLAPWLTWRVPPTDPIWTAAYFAALGVLAVALSSRVRAAAGIAAGVSLLVILSAPGVESSQPGRGRLRVTLIDVGQGEAALVQTPGGHALLIDAGGTPGPFDIGGRVVTPALWALGVRRLDWLLVTHGDRDHTGGVASVVRDLDPREIWEGVPVPPDRDRRAIIELATASGMSWRTVFAGARLETGGVVIEALHPKPPEWERQKVRNDDSVVIRVRYGLVDVWLTGDAGTEFERAFQASSDGADDGPRLSVLKVGHHGSRTATSPAFVRVVQPKLGLVSAGRGNLFGHPAREVLARLESAGAEIFRTDLDGAISVETDGMTAHVRTASGRSSSVTLSGVPAKERP